MFTKYKVGEFTEEQVLQLARDAYNNGDPEFEVSAKNCALLVIDMQEEFVRPNWTPDWIPDATRKSPKIKKLIEFCRKKEIPVIYTVYSDTHGYHDRPYTGKHMPGRYSHLEIDTSMFYREGKVWHELAPLDDEIIIHKSSYGAFYDTPLETILKNMGKDTVIVTGCITTYCCSMTARQAYERSFKVIFGSDLTGGDDPDLQEYELKVMRKGFAKVMSCDQIIQFLG